MMLASNFYSLITCMLIALFTRHAAARAVHGLRSGAIRQWGGYRSLIVMALELSDGKDKNDTHNLMYTRCLGARCYMAWAFRS